MKRLHKVIAATGIASNRAAEKMITEGRVTVNGNVINTQGFLVSSRDSVMVDGVEISKEDKVYYVLNKPEGYISTTNDEKNRTTVIDLITNETKRIYPVGRLDFNTTGVLLITNDGEFTNQLTHPKNKIEKEYYVKVKGLVRKESSAKLAKGVKLDDGYVTKKSRVDFIKYNDSKTATFLNITITEGKYHQVKRMFESVGHPVMKLKRLRYGCITDDKLPIGSYRTLKPHEIKQLYKLVNFGK